MSIKGSVPAHAYYGVPVSGIRPAAQQDGSRIAAASGPYLGRGNKCTAKNDTCEGNRVKDELFCAGHLRSVKSKASKAVLSAPIEVEVSDGI